MFGTFLDISSKNRKNRHNFVESCPKATEWSPELRSPLCNQLPKAPWSSLTSFLTPNQAKMPSPVNTLEHPNLSPKPNLPAGPLSWGYKSWLLTHENCRLSLVCQEVAPLNLECLHYLCSFFLINSLPSEMLCVWKFFSNACSDCLNNLVHWLLWKQQRTCWKALGFNASLRTLGKTPQMCFPGDQEAARGRGDSVASSDWYQFSTWTAQHRKLDGARGIHRS